MSVDLEASYKRCEQLAKSHYENFTVGSFMLPRGTKRHVFALYAFARMTDDLGDEAEGDRVSLLNAWQRDLDRESPEHPILPAVRDTIRTFDMPMEPFHKLIEANRMDQKVKRFVTWRDLAYYCDHSANPCGRMILYTFGVRDEESQRLSDATCTALQLTNFWQDIKVDWEKGRVYIPQDDLVRAGYTEDDIAHGRVNDAFRKLMGYEVARTRELFDIGLPLADRLSGVAKFDVRLFSMGGMRVLDLIEKVGYDVYRKRPTITKPGKAWLAFKSLVGAGPRGGKPQSSRGG
jgi:squalene synthase HpnC